MDLTPLLILPVVGGYAFAVVWSPSSYPASRESGHRLYFRAVFYSVFLFICALCIHVLLYLKTDWYLSTLLHLAENSSGIGEVGVWSETSQQAVFLLTFFMGPVLAYLLEIPHLFVGYGVYDFAGKLIDFLEQRSPAFGQWIARLGKTVLTPLEVASRAWVRFLFERAIRDSDFERLLARAMFRDMPIMFTLDTGKVYVGWVVRAINPRDVPREVRILPMLSGYRNSDDHTVVFTTNYHEVLKTVADSLTPFLNHLVAGDFEVVIPSGRIMSSHLFDVDAYLRFQDNGNSAPGVADDEGA